jgi:hypothetical protein
MFHAECDTPVSRLARIVDKGVSGHVGKDLGQFDPVDDRQEQPEDVCAADHRYGLSARKDQRLLDIVSSLGTLRMPI